MVKEMLKATLDIGGGSLVFEVTVFVGVIRIGVPRVGISTVLVRRISVVTLI